MRRDVYHLIRVDTRHLRPYDVVQVSAVSGLVSGRTHYRVIETPVRRTFTKRGAERVAARLNSREAL